MEINLQPFPVLVTERLILRQLSTEDKHEIFFLRSDSQVNEFLVAPLAKTIRDAEDFINKINTATDNNESVYWAITLNTETRLIGTICIWNISHQESKAEIGYVLHPAFQGLGLMQEALTTTIRYGFEIMHLHLMEAVLHPENKRSIRLLERNGFSYNRSEEDSLFYSLAASEIQA